jgi:hypothetical protein
MVDLTSELQQLADDAARQARPLAVAEVISRGDRRHRRSITRLSLGGLSATGVVAAVIIGVIALLPASHQASHPAHAQLAAWTVVKQADGKIYLTLRQFRDPAGLQAMLRADGVPVSVTPSSQQNPACHAYPMTRSQRDLLPEVVALPVGRPVVAIINPSILPSGAGIQIVVTLGPHDTVSEGAVGLVLASPQCTGS